MKLKKMYQRDSLYGIKKSTAARCGLLSLTVMFCVALTVFHEDTVADFLLQSSWRMPPWSNFVLGQDDPASARPVFACDRLHRKTDVCHLRGDVHVTTGNSSSIVLHSSICGMMTTCGREVRIRPYTRKWEKQTMASIESLTLQCKANDNEGLQGPVSDSDLHPSCVANHLYSVPAVVFSSGGFTGNPYHDFQDVLIPLFIVSQHLRGEVVFIVSDTRPWWIKRWEKVLKQLSRYQILDLKKQSGEYCFPEMLVGLYTHKEFGIMPTFMPHGETMEDFQNFLYDALAVSSLKESMISSHLRLNGSTAPKPRKPTLLILLRKDTRVILNHKEVANLAKDLQFNVKMVTLSDQVELQSIYRYLYTSDVVMGVHGAELAHIVFMRRKSVVLQIVPIGTEWPSHHYFAGPSVRDLGLQYMEYQIKPEESSLSDKYGIGHPIVLSPALYVRKGWATQKQLYLTEQNVRPNLDTLKLVLVKARSAALSAFP